MPSEPSLSDRFRSNNAIAIKRAPTQSSLGETNSNRDSNRINGTVENSVVVVMTENAEEVSIANMGVAF